MLVPSLLAALAALQLLRIERVTAEESRPGEVSPAIEQAEIVQGAVAGAEARLKQFRAVAKLPLMT